MEKTQNPTIHSRKPLNPKKFKLPMKDIPSKRSSLKRKHTAPTTTKALSQYNTPKKIVTLY